MSRLPAGALTAERHSHRPVGPAAAGITVHRRIRESRGDHITANALFLAGAGDARPSAIWAALAAPSAHAEEIALADLDAIVPENVVAVVAWK